MTKVEALIREVEQIPEPMLDEVLDFIRSLRARLALERSETALASEAVLGRDWLTPEEDEAWRDL